MNVLIYISKAGSRSSKASIPTRKLCEWFLCCSMLSMNMWTYKCMPNTTLCVSGKINVLFYIFLFFYLSPIIYIYGLRASSWLRSLSSSWSNRRSTSAKQRSFEYHQYQFPYLVITEIDWINIIPNISPTNSPPLRSNQYKSVEYHQYPLPYPVTTEIDLIITNPSISPTSFPPPRSN